MNKFIDDMEITFSDKYNEQEKSSICERIKQDYLNLKSFLEENGIWHPAKLMEAKIHIKGKLFGLTIDGMRSDNDITLFGVNKNGLIIHELIHLLFPTDQYRFHEGFADYIQGLLNDDKRRWGKETLDDVKRYHLANDFSVKYSDYHQVILDGGNFNDPRLNRCYLSRSIAMGFVKYLIILFCQSYVLAGALQDFWSNYYNEEYEKAFDSALLLLEEEPDNPEYNLLMGRTLTDSFRFEKALPYLEKANNHSKDNILIKAKIYN